MRKFTTGLFQMLALIMLLVMGATSAEAVLKDFGPLNFAGYPTYYRDNNNLALQQCLSKAISPVSGLPICNLLPFPNITPPFDPALPITFPPNPPTGFNWPLESFYFSVTADPLTFAVAPGKGKISAEAALEGTFAGLNPVPGEQITFTRIRTFLVGVPNGVYKFTHPYGVDNLTVTGGTLRFTRDIGAGGAAFVGALVGDVGPWLQWTPDAALIALGQQNADGTITTTATGEVFLGDFNVAHTFTGSPFGTNFFRMDGPVGSGIGGPGIDFIQTNLGNLQGQKYTAAIPTPLTVDRVTYKRDAISGQIDVFATTATTSNTGAASVLTVTGTNIPAAVTMTGDPAGKFYAHLLNVAPNLFPPAVTVTNTADNPPSALIVDLVDEVAISTAIYDPNALSLTVTAASADTLTNPALDVQGFGLLPSNGGTQTFTGITVPPAKITVISAARGSATAPVLIRGSIPPVAANDTASLVNSGVGAPASVPIDVVANDTAAGLATINATTLAVVAQPTNGTVSTITNANMITYTPLLNNFTGTDTFTYTVKDSNGVISNVATVSVTVSVASSPPVANNDSTTTFGTNPVTFNILNNDVSALGAPLNPASWFVVVTQPGTGLGSVVANANGTVVTYTPPNPAVTVPTLVTFTYQVQDSLVVSPTTITSNTATVSITVNPTPVLPVANNDTAFTQKGAPVTIPVLANDTVGSFAVDPASVVIVTVMPIANVGNAVPNIAVGANQGTITFTPLAGFTGTATFTYTVKDTSTNLSNQATVTVQVNAPPVANADAVTTNKNTAITINVLANDIDADGTLILASLLAINPVGGTIVNNGNGTITFTPTTNVTGVGGFDYTVRDNQNAVSNSAHVTVTVLNVNLVPVANNDTGTILSGAAPLVINVAANDTDPDGTLAASSVAIVAQPANGIAQANLNGSNTVTYTPNAGFVGTNTFTYTILDNLGAVSNVATVTVTVNPASTENITITRSEFRLNGNTWRVDGSTTARVLGETVKVFYSALVPADTTTQIGTANVDVNGVWSYQQQGGVALNAGRRISLLTNLGKKVENITLTVR